MARTKKQRKKKKKNISIRAEVIFQLMITTIFFMIILDMEGGDKEAAFFNRYDFAYAGRNTVNQAAKHLDTLAPKLVNQLMSKATTGLDNITAKRVEQIS